MIRKIIICTIALIVCLSWRKEENQPCIIIDLAKAINITKSPTKLTLNDISENIKIIPTETTDFILFEHMIILGATKKNIIVQNSSLSNRDVFLYFVNRETGKASVLLNKQGNGPGEYTNINSAVINEQAGIVSVVDHRKRISTYNFHGDFINSVRNDSVMIFTILNDGNFLVGFPSYSQIGYALGIYDKSWKLKRKGIPKEYHKTAMTHFDEISKFNNEYYYHVALGDTLYQVTSEYDKPYLVRSKGRYKLPPSVYASISELNKNRFQYIYGDHGYIISKYYFLSYEYNRENCYDIWNLENSTLIYRNRVSYKDNDSKGGIPLSIGNIQINVWPNYIDGDTMYCTVDVENALKLVPSLPEDTNPIILELKIK
jgi:hypothetical protein